MEFLSFKVHLNNLTMIPQLIQQFYWQRYLHHHLWSALFSTQYFVENLGVVLSIQKGKELRTHDLSIYASEYDLGKNLDAEDKKTLEMINVKKASEYPYTPFKSAQTMMILSQRYATSRIATLAGEGFNSSSTQEKPLSELQSHDLSLIKRMGRLVHHLLELHC